MWKRLLLPLGKHHPRYTEYVGWSFISNVIVSAESAMGAHSMLATIGSDSEITRTINYVGKDVIGQIGALGYISKMSDQGR